MIVACPVCAKSMQYVDGNNLQSAEDVKLRATLIHLTGCESGWVCVPCQQAKPE